MTDLTDTDQPIRLRDAFTASAEARVEASRTLDADDPRVYNDPRLVDMLPPDQRFEAMLRLSEDGKLGPDRQKEAELRAAGYDVTVDGSLSGDEQKSWQQLEDERNGKNILEAAKDTLTIMAEGAAIENGFKMGFGGILSRLFDAASSGVPTEPAPQAAPAQPAFAFKAGLDL